MDSRKLIVGVDVGGTNTDAVLLDPSKSGPDAVITSFKATTGTDVTTGIEEAIRTLLADAKVPPTNVASLMIGTTHFINAVLERDASRLEPVAVIRLAAANYMKYAPPFIDFPSALTKSMPPPPPPPPPPSPPPTRPPPPPPAVADTCATAVGPIIKEEILEQAAIIKEKGIRKIAILGIYSPFDEKYRQEYHVRDLFKEALGDSVDIVCSRDVAGIGVLARENAAILNASILQFAKRTINGFKRAMKHLDLRCPLYLTSNSGQLLSSQEAMAYPIRIFSSGATNSIRGAAFLSAGGKTSDSKYVVDIGGTTTDIGCLLPSGFPRLAGASTEVGGVKVNFAMPQVESIALGGGSLVREQSEGAVSIGPESVGQALREKAKCFGGDSLTTTDIMVAAGEAKIGTVILEVSPSLLSAAKDKMKRMIEDQVDRMKTSPEPCHLLLVGGGAFLCPPVLEGVASIEVPKHADVANAVGAAVAEIGEETEMIVDGNEKDSKLAEVKANIIARAIARGAKEGEIRIIEEDVSGIPYVDGKFKITVSVTGPVDYEKFLHDTAAEAIDDSATDELYHETKEWRTAGAKEESAVTEVDHMAYKPHIDNDRAWHLSETDSEYIAIGCYILGCAGGGTPYGVYLQVRELLREGGSIKVVDVDDLPEETVCNPMAAMGSPVVAVERIGGDLIVHAMQEMQNHLNVKFTSTISGEIGGANGMQPLLMSSSRYFDIPCVDADLMGRAFPSFEMSTLFIGAKDINDLLPVSLSSGDGTNITMTTAKDPGAVDKVFRAACITMGLAAGISSRPISKQELQERSVHKSVSLAWRLGRAVLRARAASTISTVHNDIIKEFGGSQSAKKVFEGKIVGIGQTVSGGRSHGKLIIEKLKDYEQERVNGSDSGDGIEKISIPFMNENLILEATYTSGEKKILATVPDLIMVLDMQTGEALGCPEYRYGLKVMVIVAAAYPLWTTKRGLEIAGPKAFGYELDYTPCGTYGGVMSVIEEYGPPRK